VNERELKPLWHLFFQLKRLREKLPNSTFPTN